MKRIAVVLGTRPEIIKLAPLLRRIVTRKIPLQLIHTQQHYDYIMDKVFFEELLLPEPTHRLQTASPHAILMLASAMQGCADIWQKERPDVVVVQGDTNTTLAGALAGHKSGCAVAHVEAGLRSGDLGMPEEVNRMLTDRVSDFLFVPTEHQRKHLLAEGLDTAKIKVVGNTVQDAVHEHLAFAEATDLPATLARLQQPYALLTLHRPSLVDDSRRLAFALERLAELFVRRKVTGVFLIHPRTRKILQNMDQSTFAGSHLLIHEPVGYLPMLQLLSKAAFVVTDSGGLQEETAILRVPCVTLRTTTERPETLDAGGNILVFPDDPGMCDKADAFLSKPRNWKQLYSVAQTSDTILEHLLQTFP
jgi:UDP-N-acetylglucosamine 2-epimerase (non-hydrolysing)